MARKVILPPHIHGQRIFLHFEAITYWGRVNFNGKQLGTMGPYVPYEFEVTAFAHEGENAIQVEIADLVPFKDGTASSEIALGVNPGWEAYGGIIRDVWIEIRPAAFVENVRLAYGFSKGYAVCLGHPRLFLSGLSPVDGIVELSLKHRAQIIFATTTPVKLIAGTNEVELSFELNDPALWSPNLPNLYELTVRLKTNGAEDSSTTQTGFREIKTQGREFRLNGERLVLKGVCRHDMWKDDGFTLSPRQQEQDMRMIKGLGGNFVRLVHYPHDRRIVTLADQLGLLVSEEPGFWQTNFQTMDKARTELGFEILERTIRRDWNSPSVMAWFLSNECILTEEFLREGKRRCNRIDPIQRLVSAANDKPAKDVKSLYIAAGMDFFDQHEYTEDVEEFAQEAQFVGPSKPLTFSEWGGKSVGQSESLMRRSVDRLIDLVESGDLSGHMFWSWQDLRQYTRIDGEMRDGVLESGVVSEARDPRLDVSYQLTRLFEQRRELDAPSHAPPPSIPSTCEQPKNRKTPSPGRPQVLPLKWVPFARGTNFLPLNLQSLADSTSCRNSWASFERTMADYWANSSTDDQWKRTGSRFRLWQASETKIAGVDFRFPVIENEIRPIVLTSQFPEITIPVDQSCLKLHILGQVTFPEGYPMNGARGDRIAVYTLKYENGESQSLPIRKGIEVAQSNRIHSATRIDPIATAAQPVLEFVKDTAREEYQILLLSVPVGPTRLTSLRCILEQHSLPVAIFAITLEMVVV